MELSELKTISADNAAKIITKIKKLERKVKYGKELLTIPEVLKMYDPNQHDVYDASKRADKQIEVPASDWTSANQHTIPDTVYVNRSSAPTQKLIVSRANAFLTGNPIDMVLEANASPKQKDLKEVIKRMWDNNKLDYRINEIGRTMMSETHCALILYSVTDEQADEDYKGLNFNSHGLTLKTKIVCKSKGDDLYPIFDEIGTMIGFCRSYVSVNEDDVKSTIWEIYTAENITILTEKNGSYSLVTKKNVVKKIPVIYFAQDKPEWLDVQKNIERSEELVSNFGDTNDYFSSPTIVVKGETKGFSKKGERGKILEIEDDASVDLLEWDNATEAVSLEYSIQKGIIMEGTQTPDISFESMKGLGVFSGIALKMLFFDASLKVQDKLPTFGESVQRLLNYFKAAVSTFDVSFESVSATPLKPKITAYMPENLQERIDLLSTASEGQPTISQETAVRLNPMVENKEEEILALQKQQEKQLGLAMQI